jgi:hypothetical protein
MSYPIRCRTVFPRHGRPTIDLIHEMDLKNLRRRHDALGEL